MTQGAYPTPSDEHKRLAELASFQILDTQSERDLDDIVVLASQLCGTPIDTVTFVDQRRQWFKAKVGLDIDETPRDVAFCANTQFGPKKDRVPKDPITCHVTPGDRRLPKRPSMEQQHCRSQARIRPLHLRWRLRRWPPAAPRA